MFLLGADEIAEQCHVRIERRTTKFLREVTDAED
jgi:hypothetical protein